MNKSDKPCSKCNQNERTSSSSWCKPCHAVYAKAYRLNKLGKAPPPTDEELEEKRRAKIKQTIERRKQAAADYRERMRIANANKPEEVAPDHLDLSGARDYVKAPNRTYSQYACVVCGERFRYVKKLDKHLVMRHGIKPQENRFNL